MQSLFVSQSLLSPSTTTPTTTTKKKKVLETKEQNSSIVLSGLLLCFVVETVMPIRYVNFTIPSILSPSGEEYLEVFVSGAKGGQ